MLIMLANLDGIYFFVLHCTNLSWCWNVIGKSGLELTSEVGGALLVLDEDKAENYNRSLKEKRQVVGLEGS